MDDIPVFNLMSAQQLLTQLNSTQLNSTQLNSTPQQIFITQKWEISAVSKRRLVGVPTF
jgi:hypothetical protein